MLHACATRFDVTENIGFFCFWCELFKVEETEDLQPVRLSLSALSVI